MNPTRDLPRFTVCPPIRCFFAVPGSSLQVCGAIARWMRPGSAFFASAYHCDKHRESGDVELPPFRVLRRVRLLCAIDFAAVSWLPKISEVEAMARLSAAVEDAGGLLNVSSVSSAIGEHRAPPPPGAPDVGQGNRAGR